MKVYLDDERSAPPGWIRTCTSQETIYKLITGKVTHLSPDHDLGEDSNAGCGYDVLLWLEERVALHGFQPPEHINVHSSNSSARIKMEAAIRAIKKMVRER